MRDVHFSELAQVRPIGINHRGRVVINSRQILFVDRDYDDHAMLLRKFLHQLDGRAIGNLFGQLVPFRVLLGTKIGTVEQFLKTDKLCSLGGSLFDHANVLVDHRLADLLHR